MKIKLPLKEKISYEWWSNSTWHVNEFILNRGFMPSFQKGRACSSTLKINAGFSFYNSYNKKLIQLNKNCTFMPKQYYLQSLEQMRIVWTHFSTILNNREYAIIDLPPQAFFTISFSLFHGNTLKGTHCSPAPRAIPGTKLMLDVYLSKEWMLSI